MPFLRRPTAETIQAFLVTQASHVLTYTVVGATAMTPPAGYVVDHTRVKLGAGEMLFAAAKMPLSAGSSFGSAGWRPVRKLRRSGRARWWRSWPGLLACGGSTPAAS